MVKVLNAVVRELVVVIGQVIEEEQARSLTNWRFDSRQNVTRRIKREIGTFILL